MKTPAASGADFEDAARDAALAWLALIDDAEFAVSWERAASVFTRRVSRGEWIRTIRSTRAPLGKVRSRSFSRAVYETRLPGVPDGEYIVIRYRTAFEHKAEAVETVTPMLDRDGLWRVSGYFVR